MGNNFKQNELSGVEATLKATRVEDLLQELVSKYGLTTLANEIGMDKAALSRFKNGEGNISLADLDKLLSYGEIIMVSRKRYLWMIKARILDGEFLKEALRL